MNQFADVSSWCQVHRRYIPPRVDGVVLAASAQRCVRRVSSSARLVDQCSNKKQDRINRSDPSDDVGLVK